MIRLPHLDLGTPTTTNLNGHSTATVVTAIPAQELTTTEDTTTCGSECASSDVDRCRSDCFSYEVSGNLNAHTTDCLNSCDFDNDCFDDCVSGTVSYSDGDIKNTSEQSFDDAGEDEGVLAEFINEDPSTDVEKRINNRIRKSISDVLRQIV